MKDIIEELRSKHLRKIRTVFWITIGQALGFSGMLFVFPKYTNWLLVFILVSLAEALLMELLYKQVVAFDASSIKELDRLCRKFGL